MRGHDRLRVWTLAALAVAMVTPVLAFFGTPNVPLMWPLYRFGIVLPTCGLTRGVVALASGDLGGAWRWNPASLLVGLVVIGGRVRAFVGASTGRWLHVRAAPRWWLVALTVAAVALLWANQWRHASLLIGGA